MSKATELVKNFNNIIESLLIQTSPIVGTTYHTYFQKIIKVNALLPIDNAIKFMLPFKEKIFKKDESYFTDENNYMDHINGVTSISNDKILDEILRLKEIYYSIDQESKDNVWSILQALVQLIIEYCEAKGINISQFN